MTSPRRLILLSLVIALPFFATQRNQLNVHSAALTQPSGTIKSYCASDVGQPVVYFSPVFETGLYRVARFDGSPIQKEFHEYLKGRFDYKGSENYPVGCVPFHSTSEGEAGKRDLESQMRRANKKVVEVEWSYTPNEADVARSRIPHSGQANVAPRPPGTHTFCLSDSYQGVFYSTGPFEAGGNLSWAQWYNGFNRFLKEKYSFTGRSNCYVETLADAQRLIKARTEGARVSGRKIVDTGWRYNPTAAAVAKPSPKDDDPEPNPQRPPSSPTQQTREAAQKEYAESVAFCQKDPMLSVVFNCDWFARSVYNYRIANPTDATPIAGLVAATKPSLSEAVDSTHVSIWVMNRGAAQHLDNRVVNCVTQNLIVTLKKTPQASRLQEFYKTAVAMCTKSP